MNICNQCGCTQFTLLDGLYYCRNCGQQILALREIELEVDRFDTLGPSLTNVSLIKTPRLQEKKPSALPITKIVKERDILQFATEYSDYPRFLALVGKRLTTAALLLIKISGYLENELGISKELKEIVISIYQKYLINFNVAFVDSEVNEGDDKRVKVLLQKTNQEIKREMKNIRAKEKERRESEKIFKQSQMSLFDQITQIENMKESERSLAVDLIETVNSKLSVSSVRLAARVYLGIDALLVITYVGLMILGENNILLNDLLRWHREDRFKISKSQILSLTQAADYDRNNLTKKLMARMVYFSLTSGVAHLIDAYSFLSFLVQVIQLPQVIPTPPHELMLKRFIYDLNLPTEFFNRVKVLQEFIEEPRPCFDQSWLRKNFPLADEEMSVLLTDAEVVGPKSFLWNMRAVNYDKSSVVYGLLSFETKVLSLVLFTLTLIYSQELVQHRMKISHEQDSFNIWYWLLQISMKTQIRAGKSIDQVLSTSNHDDDSGLMSVSCKRQGTLGKWSKNRMLQCCLPQRVFLPPKEKIFKDCFPLDHSGQCTASKDALYAPYRSLNSQIDDVDESSMCLGRSRMKIYSLEFSEDKLPLLQPNEIESSLSLNDWKTFFPSFSKYQRIPERDITTYSHSDTHLLESQWISNLYENDKKFHHWSFIKCLTLLSTVIGEKEEILYLSYLMVEEMFFNLNGGEECSELAENESLDIHPNLSGRIKKGQGTKVWSELVAAFW